jgi:dephospho-CoA kinase
MALIYITGAPGAGKSTVQTELQSRGEVTYDMDDPDLGGPYNLQSGLLVTIPPADQREPDYFDKHEWRIYIPKIEALKTKAVDKNIFVCGVAPSDQEILHIFDKIVYLELEDEVLLQRLQTRENNDYGRNKSDVEQIMKRKHEYDQRYANLGSVIVINAILPVAKLTDAIIAQI